MKKKRLFMIHTMPFVMDKIIGPLERQFLAEHPDVETQHIVDTSLLADTMEAGEVTPTIGARLLSYVRGAEEAGASMVLLTCTSMGEGMEHVGDFAGVPTLCITEPLVKEALAAGTRIGIIGTVPTSPAQIIAPLMAEAGRRGLTESDLEITTVVSEEAFEARRAGDDEAHDRAVSEAARRLVAGGGVDVIILAQASMSGARLEDPGVPVLKLGPSAFEAAGQMLAAM